MQEHILACFHFGPIVSGSHSPATGDDLRAAARRYAVALAGWREEPAQM